MDSCNPTAFECGARLPETACNVMQHIKIHVSKSE